MYVDLELITSYPLALEQFAALATAGGHFVPDFALLLVMRSCHTHEADTASGRCSCHSSIRLATCWSCCGISANRPRRAALNRPSASSAGRFVASRTRHWSKIAARRSSGNGCVQRSRAMSATMVAADSGVQSGPSIDLSSARNFAEGCERVSVSRARSSHRLGCRQLAAKGARSVQRFLQSASTRLATWLFQCQTIDCKGVGVADEQLTAAIAALYRECVEGIRKSDSYQVWQKRLDLVRFLQEQLENDQQLDSP